MPDFSEGRRPEVIAAIVAAIAEEDGVQLLGQRSDATHSRRVITSLRPGGGGRAGRLRRHRPGRPLDLADYRVTSMLTTFKEIARRAGLRGVQVRER